MNPGLPLLKEGLKNVLFQDHLDERDSLPLKATKLLSILLIHKQTLRRVEHERKLMYFLSGPFIILEDDTSANVNYGKESCKRFNIVTKSLNSLLPPKYLSSRLRKTEQQTLYS